MGWLWVSVVYYLALAGGYAIVQRAFSTTTGSRERIVFLATPVASIAIFLFAISEPHHRLFSDFLKAYYVAGATLLASPGEMASLYAKPEYGTCDFVNIPIVAVLFVPFAMLSQTAARWAYLAVGILVCAAAWRLLVRLARLDARRSALLALAFAASGPLSNSLKEGNTSHVVLLLLAASLASLRARRDAAAGTMLAGCAIIKPPLLLFGLYLLLRGRLRAVAAGTLLIAVAAGASLAWFGVASHQLWYTNCVAPFADHPMAAFNVQSPHGFAARLARGTSGLDDWVPHAIPAAFRFGADLLVALMLTAGISAMWRVWYSRHPRSHDDATTAEDASFCCVLILCLLIGPMTWSHYFAWVLIPIALLLTRRSPLLPPGGAWRVVAAVAALLAMTPVTAPATPGSANVELYTYVLSSLLLYGGVLLLALCVSALWTLGGQPPADSE